MRTSLQFVPLFAVAAAAVTAAPVPREKDPITCTITGPATVELGRAPAIKVELTNQTTSDIHLLGSLDGSDCKWRYPHCYFEVIGPDGTSPVRPVARCGNMNTLVEKDFVRVAPGKGFDPYQQMDDHGFFGNHQIRPETFVKPGEYKIRYVYSTEGMGAGGEGKLADLLAQVPRVSVKSNEITVKVVEPNRVDGATQK